VVETGDRDVVAAHMAIEEISTREDGSARLKGARKDLGDFLFLTKEAFGEGCRIRANTVVALLMRHEARIVVKDGWAVGTLKEISPVMGRFATDLRGLLLRALLGRRFVGHINHSLLGAATMSIIH